MRSLFLVAYDVVDHARRRRVLRVVKSFASGGQKSAYECWLTPADIQSLMMQARVCLEASEDQFALIPLDPRRGVFTLGCALQPSDPAFFYFG